MGGRRAYVGGADACQGAPLRLGRRAMTGKDDRAERRAAALRANLRRRKEQARAAPEPAAAAPPKADDERDPAA